MTVRVVHTGSREAGDARVDGTVAERVAAVAELTASTWRPSKRPFPMYTRATMPIAVSTLSEHAQGT
jgi:hypothetical protein